VVAGEIALPAPKDEPIKVDEHDHKRAIVGTRRSFDPQHTERWPAVSSASIQSPH
jgi:hypothetical protein